MSLSPEHKRKISFAKINWWSGLSDERKKEISNARREGLVRHYASKPKKGKVGFICRLGDIEVYEMRFGTRTKPIKDLPSGWERLENNVPKLTKAQAGAKYFNPGTIFMGKQEFKKRIKRA